MLPAEWHALGREAQLAAEQLATGVTILGRSNHAHKGLYNQAFFALSIGFERVGKLIVVANHAIEHTGSWPTDRDLRSIGHDISALMDACEAIASIHLTQGQEFHDRPNEPIHNAIIQFLSEFARITRYYNLASLSQAGAPSSREPIAAWWTDVATPILERHYRAHQRAKDEKQAAMMEELMSHAIRILHHDETSQPVTSIEAMMARAGATRVVQRYGRLYVMQLIRWLSTLITELSLKGAYQLRIEALLGLDEPFRIFCNEDGYLLGRKTWSIYRP